MMALGLDTEAQAVLDVAAADDPRLASSPDGGALAALAALLAGRTRPAG